MTILEQINYNLYLIIKELEEDDTVEETKDNK